MRAKVKKSVSKGKSVVTRKHADEAIALTGAIIDECGPRLTGSDACRKSAYLLKGELEKWCDSTAIEAFEVHPNALLGFMKFTAVAYVVSTAFLFFGRPALAAVGYTFSVVLTVSQFVFYLSLFDRMYRKATGYNLSGVIEPTGEVRRQVIVSGHHDSAFVFNFFTRFPKLYRLRITLGFVVVDIAFFLTWAWIVFYLVTGAAPPFADALRYGAVIAAVFPIQLYFFTSKEATPGAGDNLVASVIALKIAELFSKRKNGGSPRLKHTRLILASFDAEEAGLRGARAYARVHRRRVQALPTCHFNMDCIFDADHLKFMTRDINGFVPLSKDMAKECDAIAGELGYDAELFRMFFGAGGTDAAELAGIGAEATTLMAMSVDIDKETFHYHTGNDTIDRVRPEAVEACLRIIHEYVVRKDAEA